MNKMEKILIKIRELKGSIGIVEKKMFDNKQTILRYKLYIQNLERQLDDLLSKPKQP